MTYMNSWAMFRALSIGMLRRGCPWLLLALVAWSPGLIAQVTSSATQATPSEPLKVQMQQIRALATGGQRALAIERYTALLAAHPGDGDILLARGRTYAWNGQYAAAEQDLRTVVAHSPDYADAWSALGDAYSWSGHPQQAADAYAHWVKLAPQDPAARIARGRALRDAGQIAAAHADFTAAAALGADPNEIAALDQSLLPRPAHLVNGYRWGLSLGFDHTAFSGGRQDWNDEDLSLRRYFPHGSLALELLHADHFGTGNTAWALDGYVPLWSRAYANVRYQQGPNGGILPEQAWRVEVFQGVGRGWELSASVDHLHFSSDTEFYGVGLGRYVGDWYVRYKLLYVPGGGGSWSNRLQIRDYYRGNADDYLELTLGNGRSIDQERFGTEVVNYSGAVGFSWVRYFTPHWGFKLGAGLANDADGFHEREVWATLYSRW